MQWQEIELLSSTPYPNHSTKVSLLLELTTHTSMINARGTIKKESAEVAHECNMNRLIASSCVYTL
jgi:hypothetical protein